MGSRSEEEMVEFEVIDFDGYIQWARREDGKYAVDPQFLDKFKVEMGIK
jgi:hypothetical protein